MIGHLYIISTPIGNLEDITIRAIRTLFTVDVLLCEDTRRTGNLLKELRERYGVLCSTNVSTPQLISYYDEIEDKRTPEIIEKLQSGKRVGLVSDNGTPSISDPGYRIIKESLKRSIPVFSIPGANAALTALTSSGLPTDSFLFVGFLPEKEGQRKKRLESFVTFPFPTTLISYCSPHKLKTTLEDFLEIYGSSQELTIARELTKIHEQIWSGTIGEAMELFHEPKGEFVLLWRPTLQSSSHQER